MNNLTSYLQSTHTKRNKLVNQVEFNTLLNVLQNAAIVFDKAQSTILMVNNGFLELSMYPSQEIIGSSIQTIFDNFNGEELLTGEDLNLQLKCHGKGNIPVRVNFYDLDLRGGIYIAIIVPYEDIRRESTSFWEDFTNSVTHLTHLTESTDLSSALDEALDITKNIINADIVGIYSASSDYPALKKRNVIDITDQLPDTLPSSDLSRLSKFTLWIPGRRVISEIQKYGRLQGLSYLATIPLGQEGAYHGLFVIGAVDKKPAKYLNVIMGILGANISSILSRQIYTSNVRQWMDEQQKTLTLTTFIFETTKEGIVILFPDFRVKDINPAVEIMLGYSNQEVKGQPVENVLVGDENFLKLLKEAKNGIFSPNPINVVLHQRDGQSILTQIRIYSIMEADHIDHLLLFINDISEQEKILMRTQQLEHRAYLGDFTSVFAHEIRGPISGISSGVQLLVSKFDENDANQVIFKRLEGECDRLNHLIESFLSFSKTVDRTKFEVVDINQFLRLILDKWQHRFTRAKVKSYFEPQENLPAILGDRRSLERVFVNLFTNSITAMESTGGALSVKTTLSNAIIDNPQVEIIVSDNGPGIPDEVKNRIFEPFVTTKENGTGLGLSITKEIITDHRGSISVNTFPGGTIFHIYLPAYTGEK